MNQTISQRLFIDQAHSTLTETRDLLKNSEAAWERFFRHVHDLKASALAAGLEREAQRLHSLEGAMWSDRSAERLQLAQIELENWYPETNAHAVPVIEAFDLLARRLRLEAQQIGKDVRVFISADSLSAETALPYGAWSALVHLAHNALVHGSSTQSSIWLGAHESEDSLCLRVDDEGNASASQAPTLLAGRGHGVAAVETFANKWGAEFQRRPSAHGGQQALLVFPLAAKRVARAS